MKTVFFIIATLSILAACGTNTPTIQDSHDSGFVGLLEVTINGLNGPNPQAEARLVDPNQLHSGLGPQTITLTPGNGSNQINQVELAPLQPSFFDAGTERYLSQVLTITNRTSRSFQNMTMHAINIPNLTIAGTAFSQLQGANTTGLLLGSVARSIKPTHGMQVTTSGVRVNPDAADLQLFTGNEAGQSVTFLARTLSVIPQNATALEYGFVARSAISGRTISARDTSTTCLGASCRGRVTLAYRYTRGTVTPNTFTTYFLLSDNSERNAAQSLEEQAFGTVAGLSSNLSTFTRVRTLAGSGYTGSNLQPMCRVRSALNPDVYLDPASSLASGSFDFCFGQAGRVIQNSTVSDPELGLFGVKALAQSDGKIIVGGKQSAISSGSPVDGIVLTRYFVNGKPDASFGVNGTVFTRFGIDGRITAMRLEGDGKILVIASRNLSASTLVMLRYNPNGSLDTSFDGDGIYYAEMGLTDLGPNAVTTQTDGKLIIVGGIGGVSGSDHTKARVLRYNPDFTLDSSFSSDGVVTYTDLGFGNSSNLLTDVGLQNDGKILVLSRDQQAPGSPVYLNRLMPNGSLDTGFDGDGKVQLFPNPNGIDPTDYPKMQVQSDGKIVVAARTAGVNLTISRLNADGSPDLGFGSVTSAFGELIEMKLQGNSILIAANTITSTATTNTVRRYTSNGLVDTSFGTNGNISIIWNGNSVNRVYHILVQSDRVLLTGATKPSVSNGLFALSIARINP
jgi:uncharacterized delta-60 repeat protein